MKKFLLLAAFGLLASPAFAQNSSSVSSTGNDNNADVDQSYDAAAGYGINASTVVQTGDEHDARINQIGAGNETLIDQTGFSHKGVETMQVGNGNFTDIIQVGGDASAETGGNSLTRVELDGDDNDVDVYQDGDQHKVFVELQTGDDNNRNTVDIEQFGSKNETLVDINGDDNLVETLQDGADNDIGEVFGTVGVDIDGDRNVAKAQQRGDRNTTTFVVAGDDNRAIERMTSGDDNLVTIDQIGSSNRAVYEIWGDDNAIDIDQTGDSHDAFINGRGTPPAPGGGVSGNTVDIDQFGGDGNSLRGYLANGSETNMITVQQDGSGNAVAGTFGPAGDAGLFVDGDSNMINVSQTGMDNTAQVQAVGNSNTATITQN